MQKISLLGGLCLAATLAQADTAEISKVNTQEWPSKHPTAMEEAVSMNRVGTLRYLRREQPTERSFEVAVRWSVSGGAPLGNVILRLEYRQAESVTPQTTELKFPALKSGSRWSRFTMKGKEFEQGGDVAAWKVSVLRDSTVLATKHSLLWGDPTPPKSAKQP